MTSQLDTLHRTFKFLLEPVAKPLAEFAPDEGARGEDPLWQLGHAGHDACQALISPFLPDSELPFRFGDSFHGSRVQEPWGRDEHRPTYDELREWWTAILGHAESAIRGQEAGAALPAAIRFTADEVQSVEEACNYVLFHTSFHMGRLYELLAQQKVD